MHDFNLKQRIEFSSIREALLFADGKGGRFFEQADTGKAFWFSHHHTMTEVMLNSPGSGVIGTFSEFSHILL